MPSRHCLSFIRVFVFIAFILICGLTGSIALGQGAKQKLPDTSIPDADHVQQRSEWFFRGRLVPSKPSAELRRRHGCHARQRSGGRVTPGNSPASVVMTISTTATTAALRRSSSFVYAIWLLFPGIVIGSVAVDGSGARRRRRFVGSIAMLFLFLTLLSCGGVSTGGGGGGHQGTPPGNYSVSVTGTSSGNAHSTQVTLVVN